MRIAGARNLDAKIAARRVVRRTALVEAGGWAEWCICEDAELGLRLLERGHEAVYVPETLGLGVLPADFAAYKSQRSRWAYGAVRIMCGHARALFLGGTRLTFMQRLHFITGWLPWFGDALHLLFTIAMAAWSLGMLLHPENFPAPATVLLLPVLLVNGFLLLRTWTLYSARVPCGVTDRLAAMTASMALVPTVGASILYGLISSKRPFLRTCKIQSAHSLYNALKPVIMELFLFLLLLTLLIAMLAVSPHAGTGFRLWCLLLALHSTPYLAAVGMSYLSQSEKKHLFTS